jgi:hypothetical protein
MISARKAGQARSSNRALQALQGSAVGPVLPIVRSPAREIACRHVRGAWWLACGESAGGLLGVC